MIEISDVSHQIAGTPILTDINLTLPRGGITALIGPNGAGKSTLLSLIARLTKLQSGWIRVDGADVTTTPTDVLAQHLSILRQDNSVTARLTVADLVGFGRYPHHKGRPTAEDRTHIDAALDMMGLRPLSGRFLDELSGGQRQRAYVAMVLAQDTDYVLLDEPLNNLDMKHARQMMERLKEASRLSGKSFVIVVHDINFAAAYADLIVALKGGRVHSMGTPAEIVNRPRLSDVFDLDIAVETVGGHPFALHQIAPEPAFKSIQES